MTFASSLCRIRNLNFSYTSNDADLTFEQSYRKRRLEVTKQTLTMVGLIRWFRWWIQCSCVSVFHDDVIKWKHFPRYWPFVRWIHRSPVNSPHKGQWRGALMFSVTGAWINDWVNNGKDGDLRCHRAHYDVTVMRISVATMQLDIRVLPPSDNLTTNTAVNKMGFPTHLRPHLYIESGPFSTAIVKLD